jgi:kinesin family protein C1
MELTFMDNQVEEIVSHTKLMENRLEALISENKKVELEIIKTSSEAKQMTDYIEECYMAKKKLNNELQELRGNIRVYCRIRPFLSSETDEGTYELVNENTLKLKVPKENHKSENHQKDYIFNFEQIFDMKENQESIFNELAQLIQSSVDGKNVCIFAYGQTGSGKTYTMQGGDSGHSKGIIPRSIELIFSEVERARKYQWESEVSVTIQEVYLDNVKDLLMPKSSCEEVLNKFEVKFPAEIYSLLEEAGKNRKVAETICNEHSSRSHLIFTIHILSRNMDKNLERRGSLNLVDLAGSERVALSKVEGDRMKETQAINKSLTQLGVVISALAKKEPHVPFRNSKLTFLLQKYLEGDSKTLMFVNISPRVNDFNQTLCSLRFAEKVKECKIKK